MNLSHTCSGHSSYKALEAPVVFIVDADATVRDALESLIFAAGWEPRAIASAEEFLECPCATGPSCLLVELELPGLGGLELQRLVADRPGMPVIFMSSHADIHATVRAMKGGAFEFLVKPLLPEVLLDAIRGAMQRSHAALRHQAHMHALQERYESLSRREREVMSLLVGGRLNKQVGGELGISEITVKAHRGKMMRKMKAGSFAELVTMAARLSQATQADALGFAAMPAAAN